jgi:heme exporter protein B
LDLIRKSYYIFQKDIKAEWRTKEMINSVLIFAFLVVVIISFAFNPARGTTQDIFPGVIWVAFIFAGILGLNRSFSTEKINDCLLGLMLCPVDRTAIYFGKVLANTFFMFAIELVSLPVFLILFNYSFTVRLLLLIPLLLLCSLGFIAIGTFLSALTANTRSSDVLLPLVLFPVLVPLLIASVEATRTVLTGDGLLAAAPWLLLIIAFNLLSLALSFLLFDYLLEV